MSQSQKRFFSQIDESEPWVTQKEAKVTVVKAKPAMGKMKGAFARAVKKVVKSMAEKKEQAQTLSNGAIGAGGNVGFYYLLPDSATMVIPQSTSVAGRVGNRIKPFKLTYEGTIKPAKQDTTNNPSPTPQLVTIWIVSYKPIPNAPPNPSAVGAAFFRLGSTPVDMSGTPNDWCYPMNTEDWTLHRKVVFKVGYATAGGTGTSAGDQSFTNNDFQGCAKFKMDLTKYCPKTVSFDDSTGRPTSRQLMAVVEPVNAMGVVANANLACVLNHTIHLTYEDM